MSRRILKTFGVGLVVALALVGSLFLADYVQDNGAAQELVVRFGYFGILLVSIIAGLDLFVPIPAATLTPVYVAAGFQLPAIIALLVVGTAIADGIGYLIGVAGRHITAHAHPKFQEKLESFATRHRALVLPFVFLFAALSPFPNELIVIPLAVIGIRYRALFVPLFLGTIVYQTLFAYGITGTFNYLF